MSDKLREAAQDALDLLDNDDRNCSMAAYILRVGLAEPEQKPVAWMNKHGACVSEVFKKVRSDAEEYTTPLYTAPPRREWVGLTDEERDLITDKVIGFNSCCGWEDDYARAIESRLKEKNT